MKALVLPAIALFCLFPSPSRLHGAYLLDFVAAQDGTTNWVNGSLGWDFTVGASDIVVSAIGFWDSGSNGLNTSHQLGLFQTAAPNWGVQITSVTIPAGTAAPLGDDGFRYATLPAPVTLTAGVHYKVCGSITPSEWFGYTSNPAKVTYSPDFVPGSVYPGYRNDGVFGATVDGVSEKIYVVNMQYATVPEPSVCSLLTVTLLLLGSKRIRRR